MTFENSFSNTANPPKHPPPDVTTQHTRRIDRSWNDARLTIRTAHLSKDMHDGLDTMLNHLKRTGNVGLWKGLADQRVNPVSLYQHYLRGDLDGVVLVERVQSAKDTLLAWAEGIERPTTRKSYRQYVNDLFRDHPHATLDQLPEVLQRVRERYRRRGQRNSFGQCKKVALAYSSRTYGRYSALWRALANVQGLETSSHVHSGKARSVADVFDTVKAMKQPYGRYFISMCLLGTGTSEYLRDGFTVHDHWVTIHGQKNTSRERRTMLLYDGLVKPKPDRKPFDRALHEVQPTWTLYDARRCFSHWCEMASIPIVRIKTYMGHAAGNISELYRQHEIDDYLLADAELLVRYIEDNRKRRPIVGPSQRSILTI
jgi:hypothetical protein